MILTSQVYKSKASAKKGIASVAANCSNPARFESKVAKNKKPYFVLKSGNSQQIGKSEFYESAGACKNGIKSVVKNGASSKIKDLTIE